MRLLTEQEVRDRYYQDGIEDGKKEMAERAEKAEGELKEIKDRINGITHYLEESHCSDWRYIRHILNGGMPEDYDAEE